MAIPTAPMRQLLEAGVHFGHHTRRWNPKMAPYIFGVRNGIHIIDLEQSEPMLHQGLQAIRDVVAGGGRVLLVGSKRQAQEPVATLPAGGVQVKRDAVGIDYVVVNGSVLLEGGELTDALPGQIIRGPLYQA